MGNLESSELDWFSFRVNDLVRHVTTLPLNSIYSSESNQNHFQINDHR